MKLIEKLNNELTSLAFGIIDSLSIHKTLVLLVNNKNIAWITFKILSVNTFFLIGSMIVFNKGISPLIQSFSEETNTNTIGLTERVVWLIYEAFWLIPICVFCYVCSTAWYQELSDHTYRHLKGISTASSIKKSISYTLYATLIWLFMYVEVQLLTNLTPTVFAGLTPYVQLFFDRVSESVPLVGPLLLQSSLSCIRVVDASLQLLGLLVMCLLYGWYGFDPTWISADMDPDTRCDIMEKNWAYFVGFGLPYVLVLKNTSFFVGYGIFLAAFPFCILIGAVTDPTRYMSPSPLRLFAISRQTTLLTLRYIDKKNFDSRGKTKLS